MASILHAYLPSEDEEDADFEGDEPGGAGKAKRPKRSIGSKRGRAAAAAAEEREETGAGEEEEEPAAGGRPAGPQQEAKRAKVEAAWASLNSAVASGQAVPRALGGNVSLASLCAPVNPKKPPSDDVWMRSLGLLPKAANGGRQPAASTASTSVAMPGSSSSAGGGGSRDPEAARAMAAGALAAAREAASLSSARSAGKVSVTETRRFAGKEITVIREVDKDSKAAQAAAAERAKGAAAGGGAAGASAPGVVPASAAASSASAAPAAAATAAGVPASRPLLSGGLAPAPPAAAPQPPPPSKSSGLDAFLAEIEKKRKLNVLDKSKMDWKEFKKTNTAVDEELEAYKKSESRYLEKKDFLARAELREYEAERDKKLAADVRTRGRL